jgi:hypothetical protein
MMEVSQDELTPQQGAHEMAKFNWTSDTDEHTTLKENLDVLRDSGVSASATSNPDGTVEFHISGNEENVSEWQRLISG